MCVPDGNSRKEIQSVSSRWWGWGVERLEMENKENGIKSLIHRLDRAEEMVNQDRAIEIMQTEKAKGKTEQH